MNEKAPKKVVVALDACTFQHKFEFDTQGIRALIARCKQVGVVIAIPTAVREELTQHFRQTLLKLVQSAKQIAREADSLKVQVAVTELGVEPSVEGYNDRFDGFIRENEIIEIPFPPRLPPPGELFRLSNEGAPPFDVDGGSFKDAVIWYSVASYVDSNPDVFCVLITEDKKFANRIKTLSKKWLSVSDKHSIEAVLLERISQDETEADLERRKAIADQLNAVMIPELSKFIGDNGSFSPEAGYGDEVVSIDEFRAEEVREVESITQEEGRCQFVAKVSGRLLYSVRTTHANKQAMRVAFDRWMRKPRKVGDKQPESIGLESSGGVWSQVPIIEQQTQLLEIELEASCRLGGENAVSDVVFSKVGDIKKDYARLAAELGAFDAAETFEAISSQETKK